MSEGTASALRVAAVAAFVLLLRASTRRALRVGALRRLWLREAEALPPRVRRYRQRLDEATAASTSSAADLQRGRRIR
jgi:hypothetical protein